MFNKLNPTNTALLLQEPIQKYWKLIIKQNVVISLPFSLFTLFFYKNSLYKNIKAQIG